MRPPLRRYRVDASLPVVLLLAGCGVESGERSPARDAPLGEVAFSASCAADAVIELERAIALLHHMTYPEARAAFERVVALDTTCAMGHWGVAMTLFQPMWPTRPGPAELREGRAAAERALALEPPTERERLYVRTAEAFFGGPPGVEYWERIARWEEATRELHVRFPEDLDAAALYALAHLAASPPGGDSLERRERAAVILEGILARRPSHPGAIHYLIHANDAPGREGEDLAVVRSYGEIAPRNAHALHMPTHIFTRLGAWPEVIEGNARAADAALEVPVGERGKLVWDELPHALEYLVYAHLQRGDDRSAKAALARLRSTRNLQPGFKTAFHLASIPARYALERRAWEEAAALPPETAPGVEARRFPWPEAVTWFARGLGSARAGRTEEAAAAVARIAARRDEATAEGEELFARQIEILRLELEGWTAYGAGDGTAAVRLLEEAAELERTTPKHAVTPAPTLPALEQLGDLLAALGDAEGALAAYERSLDAYPGRLNGLLGAARAARDAGDAERAARHYRRIVEGTVEDSPREGVREAREFVGAPGG